MRNLHLRIAVLLLALALFAGGCSSSDDTTTTTAAPDTTTTTAAADRVPLSEMIHGCDIGVFDNLMLAVPAEEDVGTVETIGNVTLFPLQDLEARYEAVSDPQAFAVLDGLVRYYRSSDAETAINALRAEGYDARPVYAIAFQGHWTMEPGGEPPKQIDSGFVKGSIEAFNTPAGPAQIGIVDGGFLYNPAGVDLPEVDGNTGGAIHGSFVASIISQIAPEATLRFASPFGAKSDWLFHGQAVSATITDEWSVAVAIIEVAASQFATSAASLSVDEMIGLLDGGVDAEVEILNLSLGTYACPLVGGGVAPPLGIERVLQLLGGMQVIAAGGNEYNVPGAEFYPAQFDGVLGVSAHNHDLEPITWDGNGDRRIGVGASAEVTAPGIDLLGLFTDDGQVVVWSGASFATAVVSAMGGADLTGSHYEDIPGLCWTYEEVIDCS